MPMKVRSVDTRGIAANGQRWAAFRRPSRARGCLVPTSPTVCRHTPIAVQRNVGPHYLTPIGIRAKILGSMNKRSFLVKTAGLAAAGAVSSQAAGDVKGVAAERQHDVIGVSTSHGGWMVRWTGWRQAPNQHVMLGTWVAIPNGDGLPNPTGIRYWVSNTLGSCQQRTAFETYDCSFLPQYGGVALWPWSTEAEKLAARSAAYDRLLTCLRTGEEIGGSAGYGGRL